MTKPVKAKAVKPVKAWALKYNGKVIADLMFSTREGARGVKRGSKYTGPVRVEIREVK